MQTEQVLQNPTVLLEYNLYCSIMLLFIVLNLRIIISLIVE